MNHIYSHRVRCHSTERDEVIALCGYSEEASGSGRHGIDGLKGTSADCPECVKREGAQWRFRQDTWNDDQ